LSPAGPGERGRRAADATRVHGSSIPDPVRNETRDASQTEAKWGTQQVDGRWQGHD
jgi:hypothetical protein